MSAGVIHPNITTPIPAIPLVSAADVESLFIYLFWDQPDDDIPIFFTFADNGPGYKPAKVMPLDQCCINAGC